MSTEHETEGLEDFEPEIEPLTAEEKERLLARARSQRRPLTSKERTAIFGPPEDAVELFRSAEIVDEREAATLDPQQIDRLEHEFFPELGGITASAPRLVRGIIFDFAWTLATPGRPLTDLMEQGARDALTYMRGAGMDLPEDFDGPIFEARRFAEEKSEEEAEEHLADDAMSFLLQFYGFPASRMDPEILKRAVDIFYAQEMTAWRLHSDAVETLARLRNEGYTLALMANYNADRVFQRTVDYLGIRQYFDLVVTSAAVEYRKPDPRFFEIALKRWDALPYEVVVVGDSLKEDIAGAIETGCLSALLQVDEGDAQVRHDNQRLAGQVIPDATIRDLAQLPALVEQWARVT